MLQKHRLQYLGRPFGNHKREWLSREAKMREQIEYYFGNKNYFKDAFLQGKAKEHPEKYIPMEVLLGFAKMRPYDTYGEELAEVLQESEWVQVSDEGTMLRRRPGGEQ